MLRSNSDHPTQQTSPPAATLAGEYWPTDGWRTAAPIDHGIDPAALATIEDQVANASTQIRSVLIVRDGYLVYEHYWQGLDQADGHDLRSVTKSVIGALVGIALAEGKIKSPDQTVGELLADQLPKDANPRFASVTVKQLLTMTSGLAGDDSSFGGDSRIGDAMWQSPFGFGTFSAGGWHGSQAPSGPSAARALTCCRRSWPTRPASPRWSSPAPNCSIRSESAPTER